MRSSIGIETQGWDAPLDVDVDPLSESVPRPHPKKKYEFHFASLILAPYTHRLLRAYAERERERERVYLERYSITGSRAWPLHTKRSFTHPPTQPTTLFGGG